MEEVVVWGGGGWLIGEIFGIGESDDHVFLLIKVSEGD